MKTATKYFGEITYDSEDVICFQEGLYGFETEKQFLLLPFADSESALLCLQSLQTPELAFVVMNPFSLKPDYAPILPEKELKQLGVSESKELCYYVLCVVRNPVAESTVNLRCPVVINDQSREAMQVILETEEYEMRHRLSKFSTGEADGAC